MELKEIVEHLESKLQKPLPGKKGQLLMAPQPLDEARFAHKHIKNARKGAVMILLYSGKDGCMVPFIKRPEYEGNHSGQVSFPGGKWEEADIDLEETALRETEEEIGVAKNQITVIGKMSKLYIPPSNFLVTPYIGFSEQTPEFKPDPREVSRIIHSDFHALLDNANIKETSFELASGYQLKAPYFDIEKEVVWGATAMILGELMAIWQS
ncbi:NUDIX hydrolase [Echinicola salinicaeni]|uniref:NUDIX hydrolase n=1 Tax=Echinicola salinicaeni TaxID=2762757 RepID=UPI00164767E7|nr:CoA pyrophosphatase [Echinicola salinicaeni]